MKNHRWASRATVRFTALVMIFFLMILGEGGCGNGNVPSGPTSTPTQAAGRATVSYTMSIPLGAVRNKFLIQKTIYLGWDVQSFKLKLQLYPLNWVDGLHIELLRGDLILQEFYSQPSADADGSFWTDEVSGNWIVLRVHSYEFVDFDQSYGFQHLLITGADIQYDRTSLIEVPADPIDHIKMANTNARNDPLVSARRLVEGSETIGLTQGHFPVQHYFFEGTPDQEYLIYFSPVYHELANDTALAVGSSEDGFLPVPVNTYSGPGIQTPVFGDTGILMRWTPSSDHTTLYLTVRQAVGSAMLISVTSIADTYNINFELGDGLATEPAPAITDEAILQTYYGMSSHASETAYAIWPYAYSDANVVSTNATYLNRLHELILLFAANLLNATEGQFLVGQANIYKSTHWDLNSDVVINASEDTANAGYFHIDLFRSELDDPLMGGEVLIHEWGHFKWDLPNEYPDNHIVISDCLDPNTIMCDPYVFHGNTMREFCSDMNHPSADEDSNWAHIFDTTGISEFYPQMSGAFHDVFGALSDMIVFTESE